jgi:hypothetical protein
VVICSGAYQRPHRPAIAAGVPSDVGVLDSTQYRNPSALPDGKVLISISDFPVYSASVRWPRVARLRLPRSATAKRVVFRHVRFSGRAVRLSVHFGSKPDRQMRGSTNTALFAVHPTR